MDHAELLKKYMAHVLASEGITFLDYRNRYSDFPQFTDEEWEELTRIEKEVIENG